MNATDDNPPAKLNIHIVSFGETGNAAAALLAQDGHVKPGDNWECHVTYTSLDKHDERVTLSADTPVPDLVIITASDDGNYGHDGNYGDDGDTRATIPDDIARHWRDKGALCYALLSLQQPDPSAHTLIQHIKTLASNTLVVTPSSSLPLPMPEYLAAAVLNVLHPITGIGFICVDFSDINTILTAGTQSRFAWASASGADQAVQAVTQALAQLPDIASACSVACNITGFDFGMDAIANVSDVLANALADDAVYMVVTTLAGETGGQIQIGITAVYPCTSHRD